MTAVGRLLAIVGLAFNPFVPDVFEPVKALALMFAAAVLPVSLDSLRRVARRPVFWAGAFVCLTFVLSTIGSIQRPISLGGVFVAIALLLLLVAASNERAHAVMVAVAVASLPIGLYAVLQALHVDPIPWKGHAVFAMLGSPERLGSWLILAIPVTAYLAYEAGAWQRLYDAALGLQVVTLMLTGSRGPVVALALALAVLVAVVLPSRLRLPTIAGMLVMVGLGVPWLIHLRPDTVQVRHLMWQGAADVWMQRPMLGGGPDTLGLTFPAFAPPELRQLEGTLADVPLAHNGVMDTLATRGLLGLLADVIFVLAGAWLVVKRRTGLALAMGVALLAHLLDSMVSPSDIASQAMTWAYLGLVAGQEATA